MCNENNNPATPTAPAPKKRGFGIFYAIGIVALLAAGASEAFTKVNTVRIDVRGRQTAIVENRGNIVAVLDKVYGELKTSGAITKDFQTLEASNVKTNMESQRNIAVMAMTMFNADVKSVGAPTNGMMGLKDSAGFSKELMEIIKTGAKEVVELKKERNKLVKSMDDFDADLVNSFCMQFVNNKDFDLKFEKNWSILSGKVDKAKNGGVVDPTNPMGKDADIKD